MKNKVRKVEKLHYKARKQRNEKNVKKEKRNHITMRRTDTVIAHPNL